MLIGKTSLESLSGKGMWKRDQRIKNLGESYRQRVEKLRKINGMDRSGLWRERGIGEYVYELKENKLCFKVIPDT